MELVLLQLNVQIMEVQLVAIVLLGKIFSRFKSENFKNVPANSIFVTLFLLWLYLFLLRFGVCCLFVYSSASTSISQNCSYIQNPNFPSAYGSTSTIAWQINKCATSKNILQVFSEFTWKILILSLPNMPTIYLFNFRYLYNEIGFWNLYNNWTHSYKWFHSCS